MSNFKVGQRVKTKATGWFGENAGNDATIIDLDALGGHLRFDDGEEWCFFPNEIEGPKPKLAPQTKKVLELLRSKGSLTGVEAAAVAKVRSLTKRIHELRQAGYGIHSERRRDPEGQRYVRYYLSTDVAEA